jgi:hypothetical protein
MALLAHAAWLALFRNLIVFHDSRVICLAPALAPGATLSQEAPLRDLPSWSLSRSGRRAVAGLLLTALARGY